MKYFNIITLLLICALNAQANAQVKFSLNNQYVAPSIIDSYDKILPEFKGIQGQVYYADLFFDGRMDKAFYSATEHLSDTQSKRVGWKIYYGTTAEYISEQTMPLTIKGIVQSEFKGLAGQINYADLNHNGNMDKTYDNVLAALPRDKFIELQWEKFPGLTRELKQIREILYDPSSSSSEIDYKKWSGRYNGLESAMAEYINRYRPMIINNPEAYKKARSLLLKAITKQEKAHLGWDIKYSKKSRFIWRNVEEVKKKSGIGPKVSIKRALKK